MNNFKLEISAITDIGNTRKHNEDNFFVNDFFVSFSQANNGFCFHETLYSPLVAGISDGMGGEKSGEEASLTVASNCYKNIRKNNDDDCKNKLLNCILTLNQKVCNSIPNSGATLAMVYAHDKKITAASIGDSRIYLYSKGVLNLLTTDHTMAQFHIDSGLMSKKQAKESKLRHILTQHIGIPSDEMIIEPTVFEIENLADGDCILICSDGLTDVTEDSEIEQIFSKNSDVTPISEQLVSCALNNSSTDNITVMVIKIINDG